MFTLTNMHSRSLYYILYPYTTLFRSDKNVSELTDDEISCFFNDSTIVEYVKQYFIGFLQYCSENAENISFKNVYRTIHKSDSETEIYFMNIFKNYFELACVVDLHTIYDIILYYYSYNLI